MVRCTTCGLSLTQFSAITCMMIGAQSSLNKSQPMMSTVSKAMAFLNSSTGLSFKFLCAFGLHLSFSVAAFSALCIGGASYLQMGTLSLRLELCFLSSLYVYHLSSETCFKLI